MIAVIGHDPVGGRREHLPFEQASAILSDRNQVIWIDLTAPSREELARLTSWLPLHPHALEIIRKKARVIAAGPDPILYSILEPQVDLARREFKIVDAFHRRGLFTRIDR